MATSRDDMFEVQYISALLQTQKEFSAPVKKLHELFGQRSDGSSSSSSSNDDDDVNHPTGIRRDGSIRDTDISLFLRSRHRVLVDPLEVRRVILPGLTLPSSSDSDVDTGMIDLAELVAILFMTILVKLPSKDLVNRNGDGWDDGGDSSDKEVSGDSVGIFVEQVLNIILRGIGKTSGYPKLTRSLLKKILETYGENEMANDPALLDEIIEVARGGEGRSRITRLDPTTFVRLLTSDIMLLDPSDETRHSTIYEDVMDAGNPSGGRGTTRNPLDGSNTAAGQQGLSKHGRPTTLAGMENTDRSDSTDDKSGAQRSSKSCYDFKLYNSATSGIDHVSRHYYSKAIVILLWVFITMFFLAQSILSYSDSHHSYVETITSYLSQSYDCKTDNEYAFVESSNIDYDEYISEFQSASSAKTKRAKDAKGPADIDPANLSVVANGDEGDAFFIMSYNLYLILLASDGIMTFDMTSLDERATRIGELFARSLSSTYDVVAFQETWMSPNTICDGMIAAGYYHHLHDDRGTFGSGLALYSKYPIVEHSFRGFRNTCDGADCLADKGVMYAKINKDGVKINIFNTHTIYSVDNHHIRRGQYEIMRGFINEQGIDSELVLMVGDFNEDKINTPQLYDDMMGDLNAGEFSLDASSSVYSYDPRNNDLINPETPGASSVQRALDYILYDKSGNAISPGTDSTCQYLQPKDLEGKDISDHFPMGCRITNRRTTPGSDASGSASPKGNENANSEKHTAPGTGSSGPAMPKGYENIDIKERNTREILRVGGEKPRWLNDAELQAQEAKVTVMEDNKISGRQLSLLGGTREASFGCLISTHVITWCIRCVFLVIFGWISIWVGSIGNRREYANSCLNKIFCFIASAFLLFVGVLPFIMEIYKNDKSHITMTNSFYFWYANYVSANAVVLIILIYACSSWIWRFTGSLGPAASSDASTKRAAVYKINKMVENGLILHDVNGQTEAKAGGKRRSLTNTLLKFMVKTVSPKGETEFGFFWCWKRLFSGDLFVEDGICLSPRFLAINVLQILMSICFLFHGITFEIWAVAAWEKGEEHFFGYVSSLLFKHPGFDAKTASTSLVQFCKGLSTLTPSAAKALNSTLPTFDSANCVNVLQSVFDEYLEQLLIWFYPKARYMVSAPLIVAGIIASLNSIFLAAVYLPSIISTTLKFRLGRLEFFEDDKQFYLLRCRIDRICELVGTMFWVSILGPVLNAVMASTFVFLLFWQVSRRVMLNFIATCIAIMVTLVIRYLVGVFLVDSAYRGFYRQQVNQGNIAGLALESMMIGLGIVSAAVRLALCFVTSSMYIARADKQLFDRDIYVGLGHDMVRTKDYLPKAFTQEILAQEAHHHPYIEILGKAWLLKLRYRDQFANRAGYCARLIFTVALLPWVRSYRASARRSNDANVGPGNSNTNVGPGNSRSFELSSFSLSGTA